MTALSGPLRRVRTFAGYLGLLGLLGLVAALLVTGAPRLANELADRGLRQDIGRLDSGARDLTFEARSDVRKGVDLAEAESGLDRYRDRLPGPLPALVGQQWFAGRVGPQGTAATGDNIPFNGTLKPELGLRVQTGAERAVTLLEGRWPASGDTVEVVASRRVAEVLDLRVGSRLTLGATRSLLPASLPAVPIRIVGLVEPVDPGSPFWDDMPLAVEPYQPIGEDPRFRAVVLTDRAGLTRAARQTGLLGYEWRYRLDERRLDTSAIDSLVTSVATARRTPPEDGLALRSSVDASLLAFQAQQRSVRALLAVVQAGMLATLLGLIGLAARLTVERRREEFALLRARGAATTAIAARTLSEALLALPAAVLLGWLFGTLCPGRPSGAEWLVPVLAVVTTLAVPVLAMTGHRRVSFVGRRRDLVRHRPSARRLTAEIFVLLLAVLGVLLLRRRGLAQASGVDPYLVSVPVLLAVGAALVSLRTFPWPLRQVGRLAARARGAVPFLGLARAGRGAPVTIGPLAVLVLAITTGVFSAVLTSTIADARDRASDQEIAADARVSGFSFAADTAGRIAGLPGVTAVSPAAVEVGRPLLSRAGTGGGRLGQAQVLVLDGPTFARVLAESGVDVGLPAELTRPGRTGGPVPAVVSPDVAADVGPGAVTEVQGRRYEFRVSTVLPRFPGLDLGARRFVVLPWQSLPVPDFKPIVPNQFAIAGDGFSAAAVREAAEAGQLDHLTAVLGHPAETSPVPATVATWQAHRRALDETGVNGVLSFTFTAGALGATLLALLAVGFAVLADASGRGRMLSRLRTMGLSRGQGRRLLIHELAPLVGIAVLAGGLVGIALPRLLGPTLGLSNFTAGVVARTHLDPLVVAGVLLLVVAALAAALAVENVVNRRMRLGEVLRLGEEN